MKELRLKTTLDFGKYKGQKIMHLLNNNRPTETIAVVVYLKHLEDTGSFTLSLSLNSSMERLMMSEVQRLKEEQV